MKFGKLFGGKKSESKLKEPKDIILYESELERDLVRYYNRVLSCPVRLMYESADFKLRSIKQYLNKLEYIDLIQLSHELKGNYNIPDNINAINSELLKYYLTPFDLESLNQYTVTHITRKITIYGERVPDQPIVCLIYPNQGEVYHRRPKAWCGEGTSDIKLPYCYHDLDLGVVVYLDDPDQQSDYNIKQLVSIISEGLEWLEKDRQDSLSEIKRYVHELIRAKYVNSREIVVLYESAYGNDVDVTEMPLPVSISL